MARYLLKRLLWSLPTLWVIATLTFFFLRLIPGGPFDRERKLPPEIQENIARRYGLDQPLAHQYLRFLKGVVQGDPGPSLKYLGRSTKEILAETFPVSLHLGALALALAFFLGVPLGIASAGVRSRGKRNWDRGFLFFTSSLISLPNFVCAALMILLFSYHLKLLPPALWEGPRYLVMPALTLALYPMAYFARLTRSALLEALAQDYVQTARAKGVSELRVLFHHALRNSLSSVVSILGPMAAALITGSFIVEYIFAIPGMGQYFVTAVTNRDYPLVLGVTLIYALLVILLNLLVDVAYLGLDPRIKLR